MPQSLSLTCAKLHTYLFKNILLNIVIIIKIYSNYDVNDPITNI